MREYVHSLLPMYTDYYCHASPGELARMMIGDTVMQMEADGIPRQRLIDLKNGAWMVDKFRLEQFAPVEYGEKITVSISPRREKGVRIYYTAEASVNGRPAARAQLSFFAVEFYERRILRLSELKPLWNTPAEPGQNMEKAVWRGDMHPAGSYTVRMSDCDSNRHLSSPKYLDYICDITGFWADGEKLCALMQVDYVSECRPSEELHFSAAEDGSTVYVRGTHADGDTAFDAVCRYVQSGVDTDLNQ